MKWNVAFKYLEKKSDIYIINTIVLQTLTAYFVGFKIAARYHVLSYDIKYKSHGRVRFLALHCSWNKLISYVVPCIWYFSVCFYLISSIWKWLWSCSPWIWVGWLHLIIIWPTKWIWWWAWYWWSRGVMVVLLLRPQMWQLKNKVSFLEALDK